DEGSSARAQTDVKGTLHDLPWALVAKHGDNSSECSTRNVRPRRRPEASISALVCPNRQRQPCLFSAYEMSQITFPPGLVTYLTFRLQQFLLRRRNLTKGVRVANLLDEYTSLTLSAASGYHVLAVSCRSRAWACSSGG